MKPFLLYITRKFPPSVGGMQLLNSELLLALRKKRAVSRIVWGGSQLALPFFILYSFLKALLILRRVKGERVLILGDAVLIPLGLFLASIFKCKVICLVHGLDLTFSRFGYSRYIKKLLRRIDGVLCNSEGTAQIVKAAGIDSARVRIITPAISSERLNSNFNANPRLALEKKVAAILNDRPILLFVGRHVRRKGLCWFLENVLPPIVSQLPETVFLIVGQGPESAEAMELVRRSKLESNVIFSGMVEDSCLGDFFRSADLLVMPNIPIENDPEGFGLVALEAGLCSRWVVAAACDGIPAAVHDKCNGTLIPPLSADEFSRAVVALLQDRPSLKNLGMKARDYCLNTFSPDRMADQAIELIEALKE